MRKIQNWRVGLLLGVILTMILAACSGQQDSVAKLQIIGADNLSLEIGEAVNLSAELVYESGQTVKVTAEWTSSNEAVATVDAGKVTAIGAGTANITAKHEPSGKTATVSITVNADDDGDGAPKFTLEFELSELSLARTQSVDVEVTPKNLPEDNTGFTWISKDSNIVKVEADGTTATLTGIGTGQTTVKVTSKDDPMVNAELEVTVSALEIIITVDFEVEAVGERGEVTATLAPLFNGIDKTVEWSVDPPGAVEFDQDETNSGDINGFEARSSGEITLTATSKQDPQVSQDSTIDVASIDLDPSKVYAGGSEHIQLATADEGTRFNPFSNIQNAVNAVDQDGVVIALEGSFEIEDSLGIDKSLTVIGEGEVTIQPKPGGNLAALNGSTATGNTDLTGWAIVDVFGSGTEVSISNVIVSGRFDKDCSSGAKDFAGIRVSSTAVLHLEDSEIIDILGPNQTNGTQCGVGLMVGRNAMNTTGTAYLTNVNVSGFNKVGVLADGASSFLSFDGGSVTGEGEPNINGQNGIQIGNGANAEVRGITIEDMRYYLAGVNSSDNASAILLWEPGPSIVLENNTIRRSDIGLGRFRQTPGGSTTLDGNEFTDNMWHISNPSPETLNVRNNKFSVMDGAAALHPSSMNLAELFLLEDLIDHVVDAHPDTAPNWWTPVQDDFGLVNVVTDTIFVTENTAGVQHGTDLALYGQTVYVAPGDYTAEGIIKLEARGISVRADDNATSPTTVRGFQVLAPNTTLAGFDIDIDSTGSKYGVELRRTGMPPQNTTLENLRISGDQSIGTGVKIEQGTDASGFSMSGGEIHDVQYGVYVAAGSTATNLSGATFQDLIIDNASDKALYLEALDHATISGLMITDSGNVGNSSGKNGAGISINITQGPAQNITITNTEIRNSGASPGGGGAALSLKAGSDSINFRGVTINESILMNTDVTGDASGVALRIGGSTDAHYPSGIVIKDSHLEGGAAAIVNDTIDEPIFEGNNVIIPLP